MIQITRKYILEVSHDPFDGDLGYSQARLGILDNWPEGLRLTSERGVSRSRIRYIFDDMDVPGSMSRDEFGKQYDLPF